jgi:hypothetical protein
MKFSIGITFDRAPCRENRHHFRRKQQLLLEPLTCSSLLDCWGRWAGCTVRTAQDPPLLLLNYCSCLKEMCFYEIAMSAVGLVKFRSTCSSWPVAPPHARFPRSVAIVPEAGARRRGGDLLVLLRQSDIFLSTTSGLPRSVQRSGERRATRLAEVSAGEIQNMTPNSSVSHGLTQNLDAFQELTPT